MVKLLKRTTHNAFVLVEADPLGGAASFVSVQQLAVL